MTVPVSAPEVPRRWPGPASAPLVLFGALLGSFSGLPDLAGVAIALALLAFGLGLRAAHPAVLRGIAPVPVLAALAWAASASQFGVVPELAAGAAGVGFLAWLADDPARPRGGARRAAGTILIPAFALGITWSSALLLPSNSASVGVATGLLVFAIVAVALLVGRPALFDREEAESH